VVGRARHQASALTHRLRDLGAEVLEIPFIEIREPRSYQGMDATLRNISEYDWLILTSVNGVDALWERLRKLHLSGKPMRHLKIAAIGPATAQRLKDFHLHVDLLPDEFVAESLAREFRKEGGIENLRVLIARAEKARDLLSKELSALGAIVDEGFAYRTVPETRDDSGARRRLLEEGADLITFTSSSTVENFLALELPWPAKMQVASIGPITSKTARERGLEVAVEARRHDILGLVEAIRKFFSA